MIFFEKWPDECYKEEKNNPRIKCFIDKHSAPHGSFEKVYGSRSKRQISSCRGVMCFEPLKWCEYRELEFHTRSWYLTIDDEDNGHFLRYLRKKSALTKSKFLWLRSTWFDRMESSGDNLISVQITIPDLSFSTQVPTDFEIFATPKTRQDDKTLSFTDKIWSITLDIKRFESLFYRTH